MIYDPITSDPPLIDRQYPPALMPVKFESNGELLVGIIMLANGQGPHPTIILLHGFPGNEKNFDLAHTLRRAGWNVMIFHYRGAWGSRGSFSYQNVLSDVTSALDFIKQKESCKLYRINLDKIALIGHSMGGWAALLSAPQYPDLKGFISIAGSNMGLVGKMMQDNPDIFKLWKSKFEENLSPIQGTSSQSLADELMTYSDNFDFINYAEILSRRPIFLIGAGYDEIVPIDIHHTTMVNALQKNNPVDFMHAVIDTDHVFSDKRLELSGIIITWLEERFKE